MMSGSLTFCTSAMHALYKDQLIVTSGQLPTVHIAASRYRRQTGKIDVMEGIGSTENGQRQRSLFWGQIWFGQTGQGDSRVCALRIKNRCEISAVCWSHMSRLSHKNPGNWLLAIFTATWGCEVHRAGPGRPCNADLWLGFGSLEVIATTLSWRPEAGRRHHKFNRLRCCATAFDTTRQLWIVKNAWETLLSNLSCPL